jgi:hypothetical protein
MCTIGTQVTTELCAARGQLAAAQITASEAHQQAAHERDQRDAAQKHVIKLEAQLAEHDYAEMDKYLSEVKEKVALIDKLLARLVTLDQLVAQQQQHIHGLKEQVGNFVTAVAGTDAEWRPVCWMLAWCCMHLLYAPVVCISPHCTTSCYIHIHSKLAVQHSTGHWHAPS